VVRVVAGPRLRGLRESRSMSQAQMARTLGLSPSYLNQLEHGSRPLTVPVLLRLTEVFGVDAHFFSGDDSARRVAELHEVFAEAAGPAGEGRVSGADVQRLAEELPGVAEALLGLHRRHRRTAEALAEQSRDDGGGNRARQPHEEVRDFFYRRRNHIPELDDAAEELAGAIGLRRGEVRRAVAERLNEHGVRVVGLDPPAEETADDLHRFDPDRGVLELSTHLRPGQQAFRMATQLAYLEHDELLERISREAEPSDAQTRKLLRIGLAHYFAAALVLPYGAFHRAAESFGYDLERLADHFAMGFETIAHRLSTLQRPTAPGVPFSFVRVDRAGNMSKRQSATGFHFSRGGGTCPLWNVYQAFAAPGTIHVQLAAMPDGVRYLWVARTVSRGRGRWGAPGKTFAIALGCELRHAHRLVYARGLDLDDPAAAVPIGAGCRVCERGNCPQRAFPQLGHRLSIQENRGTFIPYPTEA
jgi:XRE family transcriptional regulator, fatty acid utilization regulator